MAYLAIIETANGRVTKYNVFGTLEDAQADVAAKGGFVAEHPGGTSDRWAVSGETLTLDPITSVVPVSVTPLQARKAVNAAGLRSAIESWVSQQDQETQDAWEYASEIRRDNPTLAGASVALKMTSEQLDQLFIAASQM